MTPATGIGAIRAPASTKPLGTVLDYAMWHHVTTVRQGARPRRCSSFSLVVSLLALLACVPATTAGFAIDVDPSEKRMEVELGPLSDLDVLWDSPRVPNEIDVLLLERANSKFKESEPKCAFTLWETNGRDSWSQHRFDPRTTPQWRMVSRSDTPEVPSQEPEAALNQEEEDNQDPAYARHPTIGALDDLDRFFEGSGGTLSILSKTKDLTVFGLVPGLKGKQVPKRVKKMRPRIAIVVTHDRPMISATDLTITRPYSPRFGMRFTHWRVTEINEYNEEADSAVVAFRSMAMRGRAFRVARFQNTLMQWYDDFNCKGVGNGQTASSILPSQIGVGPSPASTGRLD